MKKEQQIADLLDGSLLGMLKVRVYVFLNQKHRYTNEPLENITMDTIGVFRDESVHSIVSEWYDTLRPRQVSPHSSLAKDI